MKKHLITTTAAGAVLAMTAPVQASGYVKLFGGINDLSDNNFHFESHNQAGSCVYNSWAGYCTISGYGSWYGLGGYTTLHVSNTEALNYSATYGLGTNWVFGWTDAYYATDVDVSTDSGYVVGAAAGKDLGGGLSIEGEIAYRSNDVDAKVVSWAKVQAKVYNYNLNWYLTSAFTSYTTTSQTTTTSMPTSMSTVVNTNTMTNTITGTVGYPTTASTLAVIYTTLASKGPFTTTDKGDITAFSIMANVWYEFCPDQSFHPYIGGGVGFAELKLDVAGVDESYNGFAWQAAAGVAFDVSENMSLSIEARFFEVPDAEFDMNGQTRPFSYESQEILVGLKFKF